MKWSDRLRFRTKVTLFATGTACIALLLAAVGFVVNDVQSFRREIVERLTIDADLIANFIAPMVELGEESLATDDLEKLRSAPHVTAACIYLPDGHVLARFVRGGGDMSFPELPEPGHTMAPDQLQLVRPIGLSNEPFGYIYIKRDLSDLDTRLRRQAAIVAAVLLVSLLATVIAAFWFQRVLTKPIEQLTTTMSTVGAGDLNAHVEVSRGDEIGDLARSFNDMIKALRETTVSRDDLAHLNEELAQFNRMAVGRENRMIELKREVNALAEAAGQSPPYDLGFTEEPAQVGDGHDG